MDKDTNYNKQNMQEGLEPLIDQESVGHSKITIYLCPRCGNQVNHYNSKYRCKFCKQQLTWPKK